MKIIINGTFPPPTELVQILNDAFQPGYSFRQFGLGKNKTIMARKSSLVGIQLSVVGNQIDFQPTAPTITGPVLSFIMLTELVPLIMIPLLVISDFFRKDPYKEMAKEIGFFLKKKYGEEN
jgi:hypothetical protein